jgi:uncharacterized protein YoxC
MMILVYISILVMVAAFIWFVIQVGRTILKFKKIIVSMAKKAEKVREGVAKTKEYQEATEKTVNEIRGSMQKKAGQVRFVTEQGKDLVDVAQETRGKMGEVLRFFPKKLF